MALTELQRTICRLIAENRIAQGESYVAGGAALNQLTGAARISRDIDLFHDTQAALQASWMADRRLLQAAGFRVEVLRERASYVEARVSTADSSVLMQWTQDSAYRFFPLVRDEELGLTFLNPPDFQGIMPADPVKLGVMMEQEKVIFDGRSGDEAVDGAGCRYAPLP